MNAVADCQQQVTHGEIAAASIMVPGTVSRDRTFIVQAPNLPSLDNFALKAAIEQKLECPAVLENDANAAAVGEMWVGAARGARNVICITLGTGVGGGIVLDGKLWRGTDGSAGEIGHASVEASGPECKCGSRGCLEMFSSATAIVRMTLEALDRGEASMLRGCNLTAERVYEASLAGDRVAVEVFRRVGTYLGFALANLINVLGPEVIVISGGVANGWSSFEASMKAEVLKRAIPYVARNVSIKPAQHGDNAGLLGAAKLAFEELGYGVSA